MVYTVAHSSVHCAKMADLQADALPWVAQGNVSVGGCACHDMVDAHRQRNLWRPAAQYHVVNSANIACSTVDMAANSMCSAGTGQISGVLPLPLALPVKGDKGEAADILCIAVVAVADVTLLQQAV